MADIRIKYKVDDNELVLARKEFEKINKEIGVSDKKTKSFSSSLAPIGGIIAGAFAVDQIINFGKQVFNVTAEFQKMQAVLTNTLGSKSKADAALKRISEFASNTPFQVDKLTASFVKLANQGFVATTNQLRQLGDLASSTGKDFDDLAEAVIDAQVGEFERLKEFGVRASKQGDQVKFTFKGVETQVKFTSEAIQNYVLSLGDVEGVSGSMEAISKTLGGQLSNLEDKFTALQTRIGLGLVPVFEEMIDVANKFLDFSFKQQNSLEDLKRRNKELTESLLELRKQGYEATSQEIKTLTRLIFNNTLQMNEFNDATKTGVVDQNQFWKELELTSESVDKTTESFASSNKQKELDIELTKKQIDLTLENAELSRELNEEEVENKINNNILDLELAASISDDEITRLNFLKAAEIEKQRAIAESTQLTEREKVRAITRSNDEIKKIDQDLRNFRVGMAMDFLGNLQIIAGKGTAIAKAAGLAQIAIDTGEAISGLTRNSEQNNLNAVTFGGAGIAQFIAGLARIFGNMAQAKTLVSSAPTGFATGVIDLMGQGTETSDSIPAYLSRGESVMTAKETRMYKPTLTAIRQAKISPEVLNNLAKNGGSTVVVNDNSELARAFKDRPEVRPTWDERGFTSYLQKKQVRVQKASTKYSY